MTIRFVEKMLFFDTFLECVLNQKIELNTRNIRFRLCWDLMPEFRFIHRHKTCLNSITIIRWMNIVE